MVKCQQDFLKTVDLSIKPVFPSQNTPNALSQPIPSILGSTSVAIKQPSKLPNLVPNRKIACVFGNKSKSTVFVKTEVLPTPDVVCHKRAFSSSVIRIPYLSLGRLTDASLCEKPVVQIKTPKLSPKITPKKPLRKTGLSSSARRLTLNRTVKTPPVVKLEPPEVFLFTPSGYQFLSRPEFSEDENDSNYVITISSDDSQ